MNSPIFQVILVTLTGYVFHLWWSDFQAARSGNATSRALPGSLPCSRTIVIIGIVGAVLLVAGETWGENLLGLSSEQSSMTLLFAIVSIASGFGEELIFRGYLVVQNRGKVTLWLSILGFSILFALVHPFLWKWEDGILEIRQTPKAWFSTSVVFLNSLWFYGLRFCKANPNHSLWPCIAAHAGSNVGVFIVKLAQGHFGGFY